MVASNRINGPDTGQPVRIDLRLPAPWGSLRELASALKASKASYRLEGAELVRDADGWRCEVGESPYDEEIAELFATAITEQPATEYTEHFATQTKTHRVSEFGRRAHSSFRRTNSVSLSQITAPVADTPCPLRPA